MTFPASKSIKKIEMGRIPKAQNKNRRDQALLVPAVYRDFANGS
jgi:hypothetical protein